MSIKALSCALALRGVSPSEKLLLLALANYADENMQCYPSQRRLAEDTCLSDRTIRSLLAGLEDRKIISRQERQRRDNSRATDLVTLHLSEGVAEAASGGTETISGGVRKQLPGGGEMASALTTFEPSINHQFEPSPLVAQSAPPTKRASRRVPESFFPSAQTLAVLVKAGFEVLDIERALTRMRDHEFKTPRTDWDAALRNWVRTDRDRKARNERPNGQSPATASRAARRGVWAEVLAEECGPSTGLRAVS